MGKRLVIGVFGIFKKKILTFVGNFLWIQNNVYDILFKTRLLHHHVQYRSYSGEYSQGNNPHAFTSPANAYVTEEREQYP